MTNPEFLRWWEDFLERWPDMGARFAENRSEEAQQSILRRWCDAMFDVGIDEALAVNRLMYIGDLPCFSDWDRDKLPAIVRQHCIAQRPPPSNWTGPNDDPYPQPADTLPVKLHGSMRALMDLRERGADAAECQAFLAREFPPERSDRQRRYTCLQCFDSGRVEVWHPERVYLAQSQGLAAALACKYVTSAAACGCKAGDQFKTRKTPVVGYDSIKHCLAKHGDVTSPAAVEAFETWLRTRRDVSKRSNYEPGFAAYSQQEAF